MIPVADLMQVQHPGYRAFRIGKGMDEVYYPVFLDYSVCVCERFRHHAYQHNSAVITESSLMQIIEYVREIDETDEPEDVFPLRERIRNASYEFRLHCDEMGKRFKSPTSISNFYDDLGKLVMEVACEFAGVEH